MMITWGKGHLISFQDIPALNLGFSNKGSKVEGNVNELSLSP